MDYFLNEAFEAVLFDGENRSAIKSKKNRIVEKIATPKRRFT
jgi:hypothetical protein